jgi:hypothetical protein
MICHPEFLKALPLRRVANSNFFHLNWPATTGRVNNRGIGKGEWGDTRASGIALPDPVQHRRLEERDNYNKNTNLTAEPIFIAHPGFTPSL